MQLFRNTTDEWYHVHVNGEEIICTGGHPFYIANLDKFIPVRDLKVSDKVLLSNGTCATIEEIQVEKLEAPETTYNFEVADFHTYYVTESKVLVHNDCGVRPTQKGIDNVKEHISSNGFDSPENSAMIERLQNAFNKGQKIYGADKNFYMHELKEMMLMKSGMGYDAAHAVALEYYNVSNFALYHPSVIAAMPQNFSTGFFNYWDIIR